ncbi:hydroxymethylglutaryl-CoA lyase [Brevibacterium yomogidense]|uniref:hydroxymethylglutaryl-CoA lyase n=1 Tax=Brevibacterium yomogidense TaxID=946573 RepID=UPI0018DFF683|nr:hydroxymethylglutaryl-CoA lyase [Brevibacterium yomogidense]
MPDDRYVLTGPLDAGTSRPADSADRWVTVHEVGPRDGLQAEPQALPALLKIDLASALLDAGVTSLEVASFVHPDRVPQMADAEAVAGAFPARDGLRLLSLVPNLRGLDRALEAGVRDIGVFASATESFARANMGTTLQGSIDLAVETAQAAVEQGVRARGYLSMCFGDPWEGPVDPAAVIDASLRLLEAGCGQVVVSDTIGVAHAGQTEALLTDMDRAGIGADRIALHFHDTYGQALANVRTALDAGVREFDASASGLGRCPFAPGATGNLATEDLLWMLHGMGYETGIDLTKLMGASDAVDQAIGRTSASSVKRALTRQTGGN